MGLCTIPDGDGPPTSANRVAVSIFAESFTTCKDISDEQLDSDMKSLADLAQNPIVLSPTQRRNVRAFIQWTKDKYRQDEDPTQIEFPVNDALLLIRRAKSHELFVKKAEIMVKSAKPAPFTSDMLWADWHPTFLNFLRSIPGRDGVPLKYVCRDNDAPIRQAQVNFLDDYVLQAPITGEAFESDAAKYIRTSRALLLGTASQKRRYNHSTTYPMGEWISLRLRSTSRALVR